jgi:hypothetical protein
MTDLLLKSALAGSALFALARYLRFRHVQALRLRRFWEAADAGLASHRRRPQRASRVLSTQATGPVICYCN